MHAAVLDDRGVLDVDGAEAGELLQRLFTNDIIGLRASQSRYAALLTPQGKIVVDFIVVSTPEGRYRIDCPRHLAADLVRKLTLYRLRAKVTIADRSEEMAVAAFWSEGPDVPGLYRDPRSDALGFRLMGPRAEVAALAGDCDPGSYREHRIRAGVPEGGADFAYGETFPHEASLDRLHGVDFAKGCYVGQEVVSRVQHRGSARKRVLAVSFEGEPPPPGADLMAGEAVIGTMGSATRGHGLAMVRTDRAAEASAVGAAVTCAGIPLVIAAH